MNSETQLLNFLDHSLTITRHIMTGIAAYFNLTWAIWLRYCRDGKQDDVELLWPSIFTSIPVVVKTGKTRIGKSE